MKVKELIEYLQRLDQEKNIWLIYYDGPGDDIVVDDPIPDKIITQRAYDTLQEDKARDAKNSCFPEMHLEMAKKVSVGDYSIEPYFCCGEKIDEE